MALEFTQLREIFDVVDSTRFALLATDETVGNRANLVPSIT